MKEIRELELDILRLPVEKLISGEIIITMINMTANIRCAPTLPSFLLSIFVYKLNFSHHSCQVGDTLIIL